MRPGEPGASATPWAAVGGKPAGRKMIQPHAVFHSSARPTDWPSGGRPRHHGYTGKRGYHPLLAIAAGTGDVLMSNWEPAARGPCQHRRDAPHTSVREIGARVRYGGCSVATPPRRQRLPSITPPVPLLGMDVRFSITIRQAFAWRNLIEADIHPRRATTAYPISRCRRRRCGGDHLAPPSGQPDRTGRLIVRRVAAPGVGALRRLQLSRLHQHVRAGGDGLELEADHRRHSRGGENALLET